MAKIAKVWADRISKSRSVEKKWRALGRRIVKRYRDEMGNTKEAKFNILYANTSVLQPALFSQVPRPDVRRQFSDQDPVGATAAEVIERCLHFYRDTLTRAVRSARDDMLLPGRGIARVIYKSKFENFPITMEDIDPITGEILVQPRFIDEFGEVRNPSDAEINSGEIEEKVSESVEVEYVYWEDFAFSDARNWEDVWWVGFRNTMGEAEAKELFGKDADLLDEPEKKSKDGETPVDKEFEVWEIWDKNTRRRYWISPGSEEFFFKEDDPLGLKGFFPCPKPMYGIETTDTLVPVPPYVQYESQAVGLDLNTKRQAAISKAMKMVGRYAGSEKNTIEAFKNAEDGSLIPVEIMDKSLRESIEWMPIEAGAVALQQLMLRANDMEKKVFQISGVSDILRGDTKERESATAQKIKASTGSLRLRPMREQIEEFMRDIFVIMGEIIAEKFEPETISKITGMQIPPEVFALLRNQQMRDFKVDIETDSTVQPDAQLEKQEMVEFIGAFSPMLQQVVGGIQAFPPAAPALMKVMVEFMRKFKIDPKIESEIDKMAEAILQQSQQPPGPSETEIKEKAATERVQISSQAKGQIASQGMQFEASESEKDRQLKREELVLKDIASDEDRDAST